MFTGLFDVRRESRGLRDLLQADPVFVPGWRYGEKSLPYSSNMPRSRNGGSEQRAIAGPKVPDAFQIAVREVSGSNRKLMFQSYDGATNRSHVLTSNLLLFK